MKISKLFIILLLVFSTSTAIAKAEEKEELNILFIGNSFTARHDLSNLVKKVFEEGKPGLKVNVSTVIYGGQSLFQHTEYYYSQTFLEQRNIDVGTIMNRIGNMETLLDLNDPPQEFIHFWQDLGYTTNVPDFPKDFINIAIQRHRNLVNNNPRTKWDFVVLQSWMDENENINDDYAKYVWYWANIAKEQGAEVVLYITAPDIQNQAPVSEPVKQEDVDREINYVLELAREIKPYAVVHVPLAINMIQERGTNLTFRYVNDFHPNQRTAFLTANMFYAAFFNESTEGFEFNTVTENKTHSTTDEPNVKLDPDDGPATVVFEGEEKSYLQNMAYSAVMKFVDWWKGKDPIPVSEISIVNVPSDTVDLDKSYQLYVYVKPLYATDKSVIWEVTSGNAVTIGENGLMKTVAEGKASIKVTTANGALSDSCVINVKKKVIKVYGLTIGNCPTTILQTGDTLQLVALVAPADAEDTSVTWRSSNPQVATVDENGLISPLSQGSVKITVTTNDGGYTKTCNIGVMASTTALENYINKGIKIYPNPFTNKLLIENLENEHFIIYDILGQKVFDNQITGEKEHTLLNTSSWQKGVYLVRTAAKNAVLIKQ